MIIKFTHNGFHGRTSVSFRAAAGTQPGDEVQVSARVARRLNAAVCGDEACMCCEGVAHTQGYDLPWTVIVPDSGEMRGNYPQG